MLNYDDYIATIVFIIIILIIFWLTKRYSASFSKLFLTEGEMVAELRMKLVDLEKKIVSLELTIQVLMDRLNLATNALQPSVVARAAIVAATVNSRPVLLVYGDSKFGEADRDAMRRSGVSFFRLASGKVDDLQRELQRRRSDGKMYDIVHLSGHSCVDGLVMGNAPVNASQLAEVLSGVRCVFLASCTNQDIADKLVGVVNYVVVVYEDIDSALAVEFTYEFYKRYKIALDVDVAFSGALAVLPGISEYIDLRRK
jgi:hypothetical protein